MQLKITSIALLSLVPLFLFLSGYVIVHRTSKKVSLGHQDDPELFRKVRMHGNFTEYTPITIILLALCELHQVSYWILILASSLFVIGRYAHAYGISSVKAPANFRIGGMVLTFSSITLSAVALLISIF